jgi:hypothetical protein
MYSYSFTHKYDTIFLHYSRITRRYLMKKRLSIVLLILLSITLVFTSCGKKAAAPAAVAPAATVAPAPAPAAPAKVAVDADAVLLAAAKEYFPALATSNNMISAKDLKALLDDNPVVYS